VGEAPGRRPRGNSPSPDGISVKAIFYALYFGSENHGDAASFTGYFVTYEERTRTVSLHFISRHFNAEIAQGAYEIIKAGDRFRAPGRRTLPRRAGRGRFCGGHFSPAGVCFLKKTTATSFLRVPGGDITDFRRKIMPREKIKFAPRMSPETQQLVKEICPRDNCKTQSEFIERAIRFYAGYISGQEATAYLPPALTAVLCGTVQDTENRICRLLFKLAVEYQRGGV